MYRAVCSAGKMTAALVQPIPALHQLGLCKAGRRCKVTAHLDNKEMQERSQEQGHTHRETFKTSERGIKSGRFMADVNVALCELHVLKRSFRDRFSRVAHADTEVCQESEAGGGGVSVWGNLFLAHIGRLNDPRTSNQISIPHCTGIFRQVKQGRLH